MKSKHRNILIYTVAVFLTAGLLFVSCDSPTAGQDVAQEGAETAGPAPAQTAGQAQPAPQPAAQDAAQPAAQTGSADGSVAAAAQPDLSVPPPGSPATQEKWDGFDEAKKKDAWAKYLAENPQPEASAAQTAAADSTGTAEAAAQPSAAPVTQSAQPAASSGTTAEQPASAQATAAVSPTTSKSPKVSVAVGKLTKAPITLYYYGLGELEAGQVQKVSPLTTGVVASLYVNEGDFVETGDLLFSLDDSDLVRDIELASEKWDAELDLARIRLNETQADFESAESLYSRDLITRSEYDGSKKAWEEAKIVFEKVRLAKTTELEKLQENLRTGLSTSPGRGYISRISFLEGEQVNNTDFIEIVDIENLYISIAVPENIITRISTGSRVLAKQASAPAYNLEGSIVSKGVVSDANRAYEVRARVGNPDQRLLPGMLMETQVRIAQMTSNFIVPKESILTDGSDRFIFVVEGNMAKKVPVTTGQSRGNLIQMNGAVEEGTLIVLQGQSYLRDGIEVNVAETREYLPESREL